MSPSRPFFEPPSGELDTEQIFDEALPLGKLIGAIGVIALIPVLLRILLLDLIGITPVIEVIFTLAVQFILAIGTGLVLIYVIMRSNQLINQ